MKIAIIIILILGICAFFFLNQGNGSRDVSSGIPSDSELEPENRGKLEHLNHSANPDPVEEKHIEETDEKNKLIPDTTNEPTSSEIDPNEETTHSNKYVRLARKALGDKFIPPSGVTPVVTQEEGFVVVTYPVKPVTKNGVPLPGADYHVQVKFDANTDKVVSIQAGS